MGKSYVLPLIGTIIAIFFIQLIIPGFTDLFLLDGARLISQPWGIVTTMFLHGSMSHLFFNMYGLFLFGIFLEQRVGAKRFLQIFFITGVIASLVALVYYPLVLGTPVRALGASGAVMGVIGALIVLMPQLRLLLFFVVPLPLWMAGIFYALIDIFGLFNPSGVANIAHLAGMASGLLIGYYLKGKGSKQRVKFSNKIELSEDDIQDYLKYGRI